MLRKIRFKGLRGQWFADADGERLPVLHDRWSSADGKYLDPMDTAKTDGKKYLDYVSALRSGRRAIVQRDAPDSLARAGYVGLFEYTDFAVYPKGAISLTFISKLAEPMDKP